MASSGKNDGCRGLVVVGSPDVAVCDKIRSHLGLWCEGLDFVEKPSARQVHEEVRTSSRRPSLVILDTNDPAESENAPVVRSLYRKLSARKVPLVLASEGEPDGSSRERFFTQLLRKPLCQKKLGEIASNYLGYWISSAVKFEGTGFQRLPV